MRRSVLAVAGAALLVASGGSLWAQETDGAEAAAATGEADAPHLPADSMEIGARYVQWFLESEADSLWAHMTPESQEQVGSVESILDVMGQFMARAGVEAEVIEQKYVMRNGMPQYWHTASFTDFEEPLQIRWVITPDGMIGGVGINPLSQAPDTDAAPAPAPTPAAADDSQ